MQNLMYDCPDTTNVKLKDKDEIDQYQTINNTHRTKTRINILVGTLHV